MTSFFQYTDQLQLGDPWDLSVVFALQYVGLVLDFFLPLIANGVMLYAWIKYRKYRHDRILLVTLLFFELTILTRFLQNIFN
jgi:hypothetical protein